MRQFASDNRSGICPEAFAALAAANAGHAGSYGDDDYTRRAAALLQKTFETDCEVYFTATGTAANSLALAALCQSFNSVICHEASHIATDECNAPGFFAHGLKLAPAAGPHAKLTPAVIETLATDRRDIHSSKPAAVSLTQATEFGTLYQPQELRDIAAAAHRLGLAVHMDGARFANAVAALGKSPAELSWKAGVDILCLGGTKNGMSAGEAILFFNPAQAADFGYRRKQAGHLLSKMRFVSAQWLGMLESPDAKPAPWLRHAAHANALAKKLEAGLQKHHAKILFPVEANAVFVSIPPAKQASLHQRGWHFYTFMTADCARFMCSWDTTEEDIARFLADFAAVA